MSHSQNKLNGEEIKKIREFDNEVFGVDINKTNKPFNCEHEEFGSIMINETSSPELIAEITKLFEHLKRHKDYCHNPYINRLYTAFKIIMVRLCGKLPKQWKPKTKLETFVSFYLQHKNRSLPTKEEVYDEIDKINEHKFEHIKGKHKIIYDAVINYLKLEGLFDFTDKED